MDFECLKAGTNVSAFFRRVDLSIVYCYNQNVIKS